MRPLSKSDIIIGSPKNILSLFKNKEEKANVSCFSSFTTVYFDNLDWLMEN